MMASVYEKRGTRSCLAALAALALIMCSGCSQAPATKRHVFDSFEISVPANWTVRTWTQATSPAGPTPTGRPMVSDARFEGPDGEFLSVHDQDFDVSGNWDVDSVWEVKSAPDGRLQVIAEAGLCSKDARAEGQFHCTVGDGQLVAFAELRFKHGFEFHFGNTKRERAEDLKPFAAILTSFKAH